MYTLMVINRIDVPFNALNIGIEVAEIREAKTTTH